MSAACCIALRDALTRWLAAGVELTWLLGLALGMGCTPADACFGSGKASPKKYEDCQRLCEAGNTKACDQRTALEGELSSLCHLRSNKAACRAMCHGRLKNQSACKALRALP